MLILIKRVNLLNICVANKRYYNKSVLKWSANESNVKFTSKYVRKAFIDYFVNSHEHRNVKSSSVLAENDSSLMFVNAGMNQFKPIFLNQMTNSDETEKYVRVVNSQKCVRVGGKHCDLQHIGTDFRHHTFFEMLGNWSFGDYYKKESCVMAWNLLTNIFKLDSNRLVVTYFSGDNKLGLPPDEETKFIWQQIGVPKSRIIPLGVDHNFWEMSESGPCGECTEIYYLINQIDCSQVSSEQLLNNCMEIWNIVFIRFDKKPSGELSQLHNHFVDTGMGLERIVSVLQNVKSNYDTDLFTHHFDAIQNMCKCSPYSHSLDNKLDIAYRILADHSRMFTIAISDGVIPDDRKIGFVLRKVMRRAYWIAFNHFKFSSAGQLFSNLAQITAQTLNDAYPEIEQNLDFICNIINQEMDKYDKNSRKMIELFNKKLNNQYTKTSNIFSGSDAFELMHLFGAPKTVIQSLAERHNVEVDWLLADQLMQNKIIKTSHRKEELV